MVFTTLASWPIIIWKALEAEGIDSHAVFKAANADIELLKQPNARYAHSVVTRLWSKASKASSSKCFGLAAARHWHPTTFHALGMAWFASPSLKEAFHRFQRYSEMLTTIVRTDFVKQGHQYRFSIGFKGDQKIVHPEAVHAALAVIIQMCRTSIGSQLKPLEVHIMFPKSDCDSELHQYFACKLVYESDQNVLFFESNDIEKSLPTSNLELLASADAIMSSYLGKMKRDDIVSQVRYELMKQLPSGQYSEESIAQSLNMSLRTLQRRLTDRNESYRSILNAVRKELALQYVADSRYSMTEISYLLGFSEPSSFARSFKRWTGNSPSKQRELNS